MKLTSRFSVDSSSAASPPYYRLENYTGYSTRNGFISLRLSSSTSVQPSAALLRTCKPSLWAESWQVSEETEVSKYSVLGHALKTIAYLQLYYFGLCVLDTYVPNLFLFCCIVIKEGLLTRMPQCILGSLPSYLSTLQTVSVLDISVSCMSTRL